MATQTLELEPDAFWRMVTEENLKTDGPSAGYMWTGKRGRNGWETYKTRAQPIGWLYQARRVNTQDNVAGGILRIRISIPSGVTARLVAGYAKGPASNTICGWVLLDEDGAAAGNLGTNAAAANSVINIPQVGQTNTNNNTTFGGGMIFGPGQILDFYCSAALQTETTTVYIALLMSAPVNPTWDTTGSGGTPNLAASTISAANTLQAVYL